jgi:hypothetical protein
MGAPTTSYATTGIALRVSGALKPHHHDKVETSSVGIILVYYYLYYMSQIKGYIFANTIQASLVNVNQKGLTKR